MGERIIRPTHLYITKGGPRQLNWAASTLISKARSGSPPIPTDTFGDMPALNRRRRRTSNLQLDEDEEIVKLRAQARLAVPPSPRADNNVQSSSSQDTTPAEVPIEQRRSKGSFEAHRPRAATVPSTHRSPAVGASLPTRQANLGRISSDNLRAAYKGVRPPDYGDLFDSNEDDTLTTVYEDTPVPGLGRREAGGFVYDDAEYVEFDDGGLSGLSEEDESDIEDEMAFATQQIKYNASAAGAAQNSAAPSTSSKLTSPRSRRRRDRRQRSLDLSSPAIGGKPRARTMSTKSGTSTELLFSPQLPFVRQDTDSTTASLSSNAASVKLTGSNYELGREDRDRYIKEWSRNASTEPPSSSPSFSQLLGPLPIKAASQVSQLTNQIRAKQSTFDNPLEQYIAASGKSEVRPVKLKLYMPSSDNPREPWEVVVRKDVNVHLSIGFALYRYREEQRTPALTFEQCDANRWNLRIVEEDGEPDEDFPALDRTRMMSAYQFDEFALVEADGDQFKENERKTPNPRKIKKREEPAQVKDKSDKEDEPSSQATIVVYKYPFNEMISQVFWTNTVDTNTLVGDILNRVCKEMLLDQSMYAFKIAGTKVLVMNSMNINKLQGETNLELTPKRVITQANGYAEPTEKDVVATTSVQQQQQQNVYTALAIRGAEAARLSNTSNTNRKGRFSMATPGIILPEILSTAGYQKYKIWRRQPMSFISRHERILAIDGEYIHIMPSEDRTFFDSPKTSSFHISQVMKCKQSSKVPANFKIVVRKTSGPKRYDLEAQSTAESAEIVSKIRSLAANYR
ncbi:hypothetical protein TRVA0_014S01948 [Trichomonascus vanleenenianus]|uniref:Avo1p n=1 Tax=Trichomonascus vanleenenianus TaxID=2268995 RepID=UPI003EC9AE27